MKDIPQANGHKPKPAVLDKPRARKEAARALGVALQTRYRKLLEASGDDEIVVATGDLATCMYENVEFVIWALKSLGGMNPPPPELLRKVTPLQPPANDPRFAKPPPLVLEESRVPILGCTCEPMEAGLIMRDKHMTSCPKFVP